MHPPADAERLSQEQIERLRREAASSRSDAFLVWQDGLLLVDDSGSNRPELIESMSVTKSVVALAIGKLITDGKLSSVDAPVADFYPEWKQGAKQKITIRHLLSHTSGLQNVPHTGEEIYPAPDFVQLALAAELTSQPGEEFAYNNKAVNLLSGVVERCSGQPLDDYLGEYLFRDLGIARYDWTRDLSGNPHAMSGLQIAPEDLLKIGQLVLNCGEWHGRQLLSSEFLQQALSAQGSPNCGYLWWRIPGKHGLGADDVLGYAANGYLGQYLFVIPERRLVVVRMIAASDDYNPETDSFSQIEETMRAIAAE